MRSKIIFKTDMSEFDLKARFKEHKWLPDFAQDSEEAQDIKKAILEKVAPEHQDSAEKGALFVIHEKKRDSSGLICFENECYVVRIAGDNITILQRISEEIVHFLHGFCKKNSIKIDFNAEGNIEILETKNRNVVSEGKVLTGRKDRWSVAIKDKKLEFGIALIGFFILIILVIVTYIYRDIDSIKDLNLKWGVDIAGKLIGSAFIATITASLNFTFHLNALKMVNWKYPNVGS